jgi:undecaprenyl-diphosphatase
MLLLASIVYGALWAYRFAVSWLGPFAPLAAILAGLLLFTALGPGLLVRYHRQRRTALVRALGWIGARLLSTGLPQRFAQRSPRLARFLVARFTPGSPSGLALTAWVAVALALVEQVVELLIQVASGSPVVARDHRITNLVVTMRTPELDEFMYAVTQLGSVAIVGALAIAAALVALLGGRRRAALLLLLATGVSWLSSQGLKLLVARLRPPLIDTRIDARTVESGLDFPTFSLPSGHATVAAAFYSASAYLLIRSVRRDWLKIVVATLAAILILLVGVSRGYLGVHYPSDILAGWALGALWFVLMVIAGRLWEARAGPQAIRPFSPPRRARAITTSAVLLLLAVVYVVTSVESAAQNLPPQPVVQPPSPIIVAATAVPTAVEQQLPHHTEGLTGEQQEPISLVFVATQAQVEAAFQAAGWTKAQTFGFGAVEGGLRAALTQRADPAGPVTPSFLAEQPNAMGFSLPVGATFAERHHIRLWSTGVRTTDGRPIWLATASFDRAFELAPSTFLPTHQIAPDIDTERTFIVSSLHNTGAVARQQAIQLVPAESGHNFVGDPFFTDGQAVVLYLG